MATLTLDLRQFLEHHIFNRASMASYGILNIEHDPYARGLLEQIKSHAEHTTYCHIETVSPAVFHIWPLDEWKSTYEAHCRKIAASELERQARILERNIENLILPHVIKVMPNLPKDTLQTIISQMASKRNDPAMLPMFALYGIDVKSMEEKAKEM